MKPYLIGLDNGGTVIKAALFDSAGTELAVSSRQTPILTPRPGYVERDMGVMWSMNCECIRDVLGRACVRSGDIAGIAVCGHGKGLYAWGRDGRPVRNGIASTDNRAWEYPQKWSQDGTFARFYPQLCQKILPCQQLSLLAWLKEHERADYDSIEWVFSAKDYIRFRLTGEAYSEATDISGSGLMDVRNVRFDPQLLEDFGIGEMHRCIPPLRYSSEFCGKVTAEAAVLTGLPEGLPVAGGMFDVDACAIAMDITSPEQLCTITGTWSINESIAKEPALGGAVSMNSLYAIPGYYLLEESSATGAGNLEWVLKNCVRADKCPADMRLYEYADWLVDTVSPGECEVYYLPFLYGSNAHPLAKASFIGLTSYHSTAHMLRAVYEGVVYSAKRHIDRLLRVREAPPAVRMAGGAANSPLWVQMFADILGYPIETVRGVKELGALGSAMAASVAAGLYRDYSEAAGAMVRVSGEPVLPDPRRNAVYSEKYARYTAVSDALDTVWSGFTV